MNKLFYIFVLFLLAIPEILLAQSDGGTSVGMADTMRSEGKIYVVVLVVAIVFTGLVLFAINSERKISRLEREIKSLKSKKDL